MVFKNLCVLVFCTKGIFFSYFCRNSSLPSAADVVNLLDEKGLYTIIRKYGEEKMARKIAGAIIETRLTLGKITTTQQLAQVVESVFEMG